MASVMPEKKLLLTRREVEVLQWIAWMSKNTRKVVVELPERQRELLVLVTKAAMRAREANAKDADYLLGVADGVYRALITLRQSPPDAVVATAEFDTDGSNARLVYSVRKPSFWNRLRRR